MKKNRRINTARYARVGKFGAVGIINTIIDFVIFNILYIFIDVRVANVISTTVAMGFSFFANKRLVFSKRNGPFVKQALTFYLVTAFGLYVLQTGTIHLLTDVWTLPLDLVIAAVHSVGFDSIFSDTFVRNNGAKALGTVISLAWNYVMYKKVVFK